MKTKNGFTLLEKTSEIKTYLEKQKVTRKITHLQVHHMSLPNYSTWEKTDKKVYSEPHFGRTESLNSYGKTKWNYSDGHGKYIAQHFNVFPDGKITTGRHLDSTPIGIKGWNANAICVEIYGDFDKGKDTMTTAQKNAVIALYGELCKRFKIIPSADTIRYHCWFTAGGTYLGGYDSSKSAKTCPGTAFFGGNTMSSYKKNFLPLVKDYINGKTITAFKQYAARPTENGVNCRKGPGVSYDIVTTIDTDIAITIIGETKAADGGTWCKSKTGYYVNKKYIEFIRYI